MVYIVVTAWYPPEKQAEALKIGLQVMKNYPPQPKLGETAAQLVSVDGDGIKVMTIFKVKEGKYQESLMLISKMMVEYWGIEGYRYTVRTWVTLEEAFAVIGQKLPD